MLAGVIIDESEKVEDHIFQMGGLEKLDNKQDTQKQVFRYVIL